jgi:hypothetical protein
MKKLRALLFISLMLCVPAATQSNSGDSKGPDLRGSWPTNMTLHVLQDAGLVDATQIDPAATYSRRLASETLNKHFWNQVYFVQFKLRTGETVEAIASVTASSVRDGNSGPVVYFVSRVLQPEGKPEPAPR